MCVFGEGAFFFPFFSLLYSTEETPTAHMVKKCRFNIPAKAHTLSDPLCMVAHASTQFYLFQLYNFVLANVGYVLRGDTLGFESINSL